MKSFFLPTLLITTGLSFSLSADADIQLYFKCNNVENVTITNVTPSHDYWTWPFNTMTCAGGEMFQNTTLKQNESSKNSFTLDLLFQSSHASQKVRCVYDQLGLTGPYLECKSIGSPGGDGTLVLGDITTTNNPYKASVVISEKTLKESQINFEFKNNSSYPIVVKNVGSQCWSTTTGPDQMPESLSVSTKQTLGMFITQIDNSSKECYGKPSILDLTFSSPTDSAPVTFTESNHNLSFQQKGHPAEGDASLGVKITRSGVNNVIVEFVDNFKYEDVTFKFMNYINTTSDVSIEKISSTCWNTTSTFPQNVKFNGKDRGSTLLDTKVMRSGKECFNVPSTLDLRFSVGSSSVVARFTKPPHQGINFSPLISLQGAFEAALTLEGNTVSVYFTPPISSAIKNGKPLVRPQLRPLPNLR